MLWVGLLSRPDARWWSSMPERPNKPHYYPHGNKNKESPLTPSFSNLRCFSIHSRTNSSRPHRHSLLHHDRAAMPAPPRRNAAALRPTATACFLVSPPPLTTRRRVLRDDAAWYMATTPARHSSPHLAACLPPSSLSTVPERCLLATAILHMFGHDRRWRHVLFQVCFRSCFQVFHLYVAMATYVCCKSMFQVFQLFSDVCFTCFICMFSS
jgi:hypothetical protein